MHQCFGKTRFICSKYQVFVYFEEKLFIHGVDKMENAVMYSNTVTYNDFLLLILLVHI